MIESRQDDHDGGPERQRMQLQNGNIDRSEQVRSTTIRLIDREMTRALKISHIIPQRSIYSYIHKRNMSSTPSLSKFIVWAPDYADDGALQRRLAVRPAHLENVKKLVSQGILRKFSTSRAPGAKAL